VRDRLFGKIRPPHLCSGSLAISRRNFAFLFFVLTFIKNKAKNSIKLSFELSKTLSSSKTDCTVFLSAKSAVYYPVSLPAAFTLTRSCTIMTLNRPSRSAAIAQSPPASPPPQGRSRAGFHPSHQQQLLPSTPPQRLPISPEFGSRDRFLGEETRETSSLRKRRNW